MEDFQSARGEGRSRQLDSNFGLVLPPVIPADLQERSQYITLKRFNALRNNNTYHAVVRCTRNTKPVQCLTAVIRLDSWQSQKPD